MGQEIILKGYFDGACEPMNPYGNMGMGAHIIRGKEEIFSKSNFIPASRKNSNNVAEYMALEILLDEFLLLEEKKYWIHIHGDSKLVVRQMNGSWKIKQGLYVETAKRCFEKFKQLKKKNMLRIDWISRNYNQRADYLSKSIMIKNKVEFKLQPL